MTEHYTMQEAVKLARENGFDDLSEEYHPMFCQELTTFANAAATRKLAEKELEVVRLREALGTIFTNTEEQYAREVASEALSPQSSTKHLDEYVAEKVKELEILLEQAQNGLRWYQETHPEDASPADDDLHEAIDKVLSKEGTQ